VTASQHMVRANGVRFRVLAAGPSSGPLAILLHGFPEGAESWSRQLDALAGSGALAIAPDMRGYGGTDAPPDVADYALPHLVQDVAGLIEAFGRDRAHVAGHDWGAIVAWFFAGAHPEMTESLTALSVGHPAALADATAADQDQRTRSKYVALFLMEGKAEEVLGEDDFRRLRAMFGDALPRGAVERFARAVSRPGRLTAALNYYRANLHRSNWWAGMDRNVRVTAPAALLWGDQDPALGRRQAEETGRHVDGEYRLEVLEGAGHWLQFERGEAVSRSLVDGLAK
jgi:pimeloyl-ACP methyl ester carboxylesterase